jgi:predicted Fe-S protein YdhL (DUF1289 family)
MIQARKQPAAVSPCVNICKLTADRSLCQGCFRTVAEISAWSRVSNDDRLVILASVARRRAGADR